MIFCLIESNPFPVDVDALVTGGVVVTSSFFFPFPFPLDCRRRGEVIIRTNDLAFGVEVLDVVVDFEVVDGPVDVEANVEVGEFTTTIPDPKLGSDWKESLDPIPSTVTVTVRGGAIGI